MMSVEWDRSLNTGFAGDAVINPNADTVVLWAYNALPTSVSSDTAFAKHPPNTRGTATVRFATLGDVAFVAPSTDTSQGAFTSPDGVYTASWVANTALRSVTFTVTVRLSGNVWGAIGFTAGFGMPGADIVVGMVTPGGVPQVTDRHSFDTVEPPIDTQQYVTGVQGARTATSTTFTFTRPIEVTDTPNDVRIDNAVNMLWAYGPVTDYPSNRIDKHAARGVVTNVNFVQDCTQYGRASGSGSGGSGGAASNSDALLRVHGVMMMLAFATLMPLAAIAAAGRKTIGAWWFPAHWVVNAVALAAAIAGFVIAFVAKKGELEEGVHQVFGVVVFGLAILQSGLGLAAHFMFDPTRTSTAIFPDIVHHWYGRAVMLCGFAVCFLGVWTASSTIRIPTNAPYGLLGAAVGVSIVVYLVVLFTQRGSGGHGSDDINMGGGHDDSSGKSRGGGNVLGRVLVLCGAALLVLIFAGFVVALYVPAVTAGTLSNSGSLRSVNKGCFTADNLAVPSTTTSYMCVGLTFPNSPPQMAIHFAPIVETPEVVRAFLCCWFFCSLRPRQVHHMILYRTTSALSTTPFACPSMPAGSTPLWAWAVGGAEFVPPNNTGFEASTNLALQIHYDNPTQGLFFRDSSGVKVRGGSTGLCVSRASHRGRGVVKITFTPDFRAVTSHFFVLGIRTPAISLNPGVVTHLSYTCSLSAIPSGRSATVWAAGLHAHKRARMMWIEHRRNSVRQPDLICNPFYDFNRQSFEAVSAVVTSQDSLTIHCVFDTTAETATVTGGEATSQEMCLAYLSVFANDFPLVADVGCTGNPVVQPAVVGSPCF